MKNEVAEKTLHQQVLDHFAASPLTYQQIADGADVPKRTVEKIARQEIEDPAVSSIEKLLRFFQAQPQPPRARRAATVAGSR